MVEKQPYDINELLSYINPSTLNYQEWLNVGMALKEGDYSVSVWDDWSKSDGRYRIGECNKKWNTFCGSNIPITMGTIVQMAKESGWKPDYGHELNWSDTIQDSLIVIDKNWIEAKEVEEPEEWNPAEQLILYLETLFDSTENVGYVTHSFEKDGKFMPTRGCCDRTAGQLIQELNKHKNDIGAVIGDCNPNVGAWIRFNPLDGKGFKNQNVTDFKYALVESDTIEIEKQNAVIRELELPVACLVHSGGKSLHAVVRVDAVDYVEYRKRVDYLYNVCNKNGLKIDTQNRNPSRLSRMPGVMRNGHKQFLIDVNIGKNSWNEWYEWIESIHDDLPDPESLEKEWDNLPALAPPLIDGILRQGHKMLIAGPSKAGKSFALIEMTIAIAEGRKWLKWQCTRGKILYVNLELDRASCLHRFKDVYTALGWNPNHLCNIDIWNLRGKSVPMDLLAPKLIRRAAKKDYIAIIIDPIYKVITGDENSADQMAHFCNQFDKVCTELGCAVIYCHHHSKGGQGSKKSMDRASGSGVFARDPDALLDLIELEVNEDLIKQEVNKQLCDAYINCLNQCIDDYETHVSQDDMCSQSVLHKICNKLLTQEQWKAMQPELFAAEKAAKQKTAWRIEGTLREFPKFEPVNLWFDYPIHSVDKVGSLKDVSTESEKAPWQKAIDKRKSTKDKKEERRKSLEIAIEGFNFGNPIKLVSLADSMGISERTARDRIKEHGDYEIKDGVVTKKSDCGEHKI